jgi:hypothetical protein
MPLAVTSMRAEAAPAGTVATISVGATEITRISRPPRVTATRDASLPKPVPVRVTRPPAAACGGVTAVIVGAAPTKSRRGYSKRPTRATSTDTLPLWAPRGTSTSSSPAAARITRSGRPPRVTRFCPGRASKPLPRSTIRPPGETARVESSRIATRAPTVKSTGARASPPAVRTVTGPVCAPVGDDDPQGGGLSPLRTIGGDALKEHGVVGGAGGEVLPAEGHLAAGRAGGGLHRGDGGGGASRR